MRDGSQGTPPRTTADLPVGAEIDYLGNTWTKTPDLQWTDMLGSKRGNALMDSCLSLGAVITRVPVGRTRRAGEGHA